MIVLYGSKGCGRCMYLKKELEEKGVPFEYCDDMATLRKLKLMSVPWMKVDDKLYAFEEALTIIDEIHSESAYCEVD